MEVADRRHPARPWAYLCLFISDSVDACDATSTSDRVPSNPLSLFFSLSRSPNRRLNLIVNGRMNGYELEKRKML
uniref:Putative secreted protein n=1 Tax=Anopheles darlingi TaxID=43151 RepID=A0A2M4DH17_ANODA